MDQNEIRLVAHFKVLFAKETGKKIDLIKFTSDNAYAKQVLEIAGASENEQLLVVAMQLMQNRGLLPKAAGKEDKKVDKIDKKYTGGLR